MTPRERLDAQRAAQAAAQTKVERQLAREYGGAWQKIRRQMDGLLTELEAAKARGITIDQAWLASQPRLEIFSGTARAAMRAYVDFAARTIDEAALQAALAGAIDAETLLASTLPAGLARPALPVEETARIIRSLRPGMPLRLLLDELGPQVTAALQEELVRGVALGHGTRQIARDMRDRSAVGLVRALRIARTEAIGAYRAAAIDRYRRNPRVLEGWVWVASLSSRTCAVCIAMHGSVHPLSEQFASHPACRCSPAPVTRAWADLGFPGAAETRLRVESGEEWFARQPASVQRGVLGPGKHAAYAHGDLTLADLVQRTQSAVWGDGLRERSLRAVLAA